MQNTPFGSNLFKRGIAVITVALFLLTSLSNYAPAAFAQSLNDIQVQGGNPSERLHRLGSDREIRIPPELGHVDEFFRGKSGKTILYIQDAHDSLEAQENIAKIIDHLVAHDGVKTVFEEGYEGPVPTDKYFGFIKDPKIKEKVSWFFMDHLRVGGAEYAHINRTKDFNLVGADSIKLHKENIAQYRLSGEKKDAITKDLKALDREFHSLADNRFPKKLKELLKVKEEFDAKKLDLVTYLGRTMPLLGERGAEKGLGLIQFLLQAMKTDDPTVIEKAKHIDAREVFEELIKIEQAVAETYLKDPTDKKLFDYYMILSLLNRLNDLQVSQEEYEAVKTSLKAFDTESFAHFIFSQAPKTLILSRMWERNIKDAIRFYEIAQERDSAISQMLDRYCSEDKEQNEGRMINPDMSVLVFGGFHKESIKHILEAKGISYFVVSPRITQPSLRHEQFYKRLMTDGKLSFELPVNIRTAVRAEGRIVEWNVNPGLARAEFRTLIPIAKEMEAAKPDDFSLAAEQAMKVFRSEVRNFGVSYVGGEIRISSASTSQAWSFPVDLSSDESAVLQPLFDQTEDRDITGFSYLNDKMLADLMRGHDSRRTKRIIDNDLAAIRKAFPQLDSILRSALEKVITAMPLPGEKAGWLEWDKPSSLASWLFDRVIGDNGPLAHQYAKEETAKLRRQAEERLAANQPVRDKSKEAARIWIAFYVDFIRDLTPVVRELDEADELHYEKNGTHLEVTQFRDRSISIFKFTWRAPVPAGKEGLYDESGVTVHIRNGYISWLAPFSSAARVTRGGSSFLPGFLKRDILYTDPDITDVFGWGHLFHDLERTLLEEYAAKRGELDIGFRITEQGIRYVETDETKRKLKEIRAEIESLKKQLMDLIVYRDWNSGTRILSAADLGLKSPSDIAEQMMQFINRFSDIVTRLQDADLGTAQKQLLQAPTNQATQLLTTPGKESRSEVRSSSNNFIKGRISRLEQSIKQLHPGLPFQEIKLDDLIKREISKEANQKGEIWYSLTASGAKTLGNSRVILKVVFDSSRDYDLLSRKLFGVAMWFPGKEEFFTADDTPVTWGYALTELLKNALRWGNRLSYDLPAYIYFNQRKRILEVFDFADRSAALPSAARRWGNEMWRQGAGVRKIKEAFSKYERKKIEGGQVVTVKRSARDSSRSGQDTIGDKIDHLYNAHGSLFDPDYDEISRLYDAFIFNKKPWKAVSPKNRSAARQLLARRKKATRSEARVQPVALIMDEAVSVIKQGVVRKTVSDQIAHLEQDVVFVISRVEIHALSRPEMQELVLLAHLNKGRLHILVTDGFADGNDDRLVALEKTGTVHHGFEEVAHLNKAPFIGFGDPDKVTAEGFKRALDPRLARRIKLCWGLRHGPNVPINSFGVPILAAQDNIPLNALAKRNGFLFDAIGLWSAQALEVLKAYTVILTSA